MDDKSDSKTPVSTNDAKTIDNGSSTEASQVSIKTFESIKGSGTIKTATIQSVTGDPTEERNTKSSSDSTRSAVKSTVSPATATDDGDIDNIGGDKTKTDADKVKPTATPFSSKIPSVIPTGETSTEDVSTATIDETKPTDDGKVIQTVVTKSAEKKSSKSTQSAAESTVSPATDDGEIDNIEGDKTKSVSKSESTDKSKVKPTSASSRDKTMKSESNTVKSTEAKNTLESVTTSPTDSGAIDNLESNRITTKPKTSSDRPSPL